MLTELVVRDLGVIDDMTLLLGNKMMAVSGETGAGKTLVVTAIDLLTGGRADGSLVRPGADQAEIEGRFVCGDTECVVRRVVPKQGRSRCYIDGQLATLSELSERGASFVDLHGQHSHQSLFKGGVQRGALDRFANIDTGELVASRKLVRQLHKTLADLGGDDRDRAREVDLLSYQLNEIESANIADPNEDDQLDQTEDLLAAASAHREAAAKVAGLLDGDSTALEALGVALSELQGRQPFAELTERLTLAIEEVSDIASTIKDRTETIQEDPQQLEEIRHRRALLRELRRKYGADLTEVCEYGRSVATRLEELRSVEERAEAFQTQLNEAQQALTQQQMQTLAARRKAAPKLTKAVEANLVNLGMPGTRLEVRVAGDAGDDVSFWMAANAGHDYLPIHKSASGGELSRLMLALRMVLTVGPPTLVFDEVDAGIGGQAANAVGESLANLAGEHQVLVVTHLAQIAAVAHKHLLISKSEVDGTTVCVARQLEGEERVVELSRMLSGSPDSKAAHQHAVELLAGASPSPQAESSLQNSPGPKAEPNHQHSQGLSTSLSPQTSQTKHAVSPLAEIS